MGVLEKWSGEQGVDPVTGLVPIILLVGAAVGWRDSRRDSNMKHKTNQSRTPAAPHNTGPDPGSAVRLVGSVVLSELKKRFLPLISLLVSSQVS